jgi:EmrB/QacA subfamily drug resistance transporter
VWSLAAALLGFFVVTLDAVIVNVALPAIRRELTGGMSGLEWVVDGYTLMFAALLLSAGSLSDRVGARRAFGAGMVLFVLASAGCGLAPTLPVLVVARLVQGSAAAVLMPASMALVSQAYPDAARRARALGLWAMGGAAASTSGPLLGGALAAASWRLIFFVNVPAGAAALVLLARAARSPRHSVPFDWAGQVAAVAAMGGLTYGAIEAGAAGIAAPRVLAAFAVAVAALAGFGLLQARGRHPLLPLSLFRSRTVSAAMVIGFAFMVGYYGLPFVMSLYLQQLRGLSALGAGVAFVPMMVVGGALTPFTARLAERFGARTLIALGLLSMAAGLTVIGLLPATAPVALLSALMILVGLAGPLVMPPVMALLLHAVPARRAGVASGVFNASRQVGGALAVAVFGALLASRATFLPGLRISLLIAAGAGFAGAGSAVRLVPGGTVRPALRLPRLPGVRGVVVSRGQQVQERADPEPFLGRVPELAVGVDGVPGAAAVPGAGDVAGGFQVGHDGLDGPLGQVRGGAEVPDAGVGVAGDLDEHVAVPGQERPPAAALVRVAHGTRSYNPWGIPREIKYMMIFSCTC